MNEDLTLDRDEQKLVLTLLRGTVPEAYKPSTKNEKLAWFERNALITRLERSLDRRKSRVKKIVIAGIAAPGTIDDSNDGSDIDDSPELMGRL